MSEKQIENIISYVVQIITGFESGLYKMIEKMGNESNLDYLSDNHQPFITIFRDLHENHFTRTCKLIVDNSDESIVNFFNEQEKISKHNKYCLLNILANLTVSIHFNLNRKKLDTKSYTTFMESLVTEIKNTIPATKLFNLLDHECTEPSNAEILNLNKREKFINIDLSYLSNGTKKPIKSFDIKSFDIK